MSQQKLRILCLHGYTSNSFILHRRFGAIRKACRNVADFVFVNGPLVVQPITSSVQSLDAPGQERRGENEREPITEENTPLEEQPRAWWRASDEGSYRDIDRTWALLGGEIAKMGGIDGVVGFSQGACLAFILAAAYEQPGLLPQLRLPADAKPLKFCIAISGFRSRDPEHQKLFEAHEGGIRTPVLSVLGRNDQIVDEERSQTLIDACQNSRVEFHPGGHVVPSQAPWRNFLRDYISTFTTPEQEQAQAWRTVPGPSARVGQGDDDDGTGSASGSGTNTPKPGL